ncbi:hypothetical protein ADUPG1_012462 [Aduncisulcus paluster]|uniref:Uncharacterized protein n=1 Tax=Aduncisulcus paluster TaxID=2918883 RepID=A0ABQ5K0A5_9EUKA|nr:hypothetical protein ADUPG1_012462 [Aduncisulcus paluster]
MLSFQLPAVSKTSRSKHYADPMRSKSSTSQRRLDILRKTAERLIQEQISSKTIEKSHATKLGESARKVSKLSSDLRKSRISQEKLVTQLENERKSFKQLSFSVQSNELLTSHLSTLAGKLETDISLISTQFDRSEQVKEKMSTKITTIEGQLSDMEQLVQSMSSSFKEKEDTFESEKNDLIASIDDLKQKNEGLSSENGALRTSLQSMQEDHASSMKSWELRVSELETQLKEWQTKLSQAEASHQTALQTKHDEMTHAVADISALLESERISHAQIIEDHQKQLSIQTKEISMLQGSVKSLTNLNELSIADKEKESKRLRDVEKELKDLMEQCENEREREASEREKEAERYRKSEEQRKAAELALRKEHELKKELENVQKELSKALDESNALLKDTNEKLSLSEVSLRETKEELSVQSKEMDLKCRELETNLSDLKKSSKQTSLLAQERKEKLEADKKELVAEISKLTESVKALESEKQELFLEHEKFKDQIAQSGKKRDREEKKREREEKKKLETLIKDLRSELAMEKEAYKTLCASNDEEEKKREKQRLQEKEALLVQRMEEEKQELLQVEEERKKQFESTLISLRKVQSELKDVKEMNIVLSQQIEQMNCEQEEREKREREERERERRERELEANMERERKEYEHKEKECEKLVQDQLSMLSSPPLCKERLSTIQTTSLKKLYQYSPNNKKKQADEKHRSKFSTSHRTRTDSEPIDSDFSEGEVEEDDVIDEKEREEEEEEEEMSETSSEKRFKLQPSAAGSIKLRSHQSIGKGANSNKKIRKKKSIAASHRSISTTSAKKTSSSSSSQGIKRRSSSRSSGVSSHSRSKPSSINSTNSFSSLLESDGYRISSASKPPSNSSSSSFSSDVVSLSPTPCRPIREKRLKSKKKKSVSTRHFEKNRNSQTTQGHVTAESKSRRSTVIPLHVSPSDPLFDGDVFEF